MKAWKLVFINFGVLLALLLSANTLSALIIDGKRFFDRVLSLDDADVDSRAYLPVYADIRYAREMFIEFRETSKFFYRSYVGWSREQYSGNTITIDEEGDRVHPQTTQNPIATVRFFGGSTLWGTGANNQGTIPAIFNSMLTDYRVLNHGESGFVSRQGLARLINLANQKKPLDLVIFYDGANDVGTLCGGKWPINTHSEEQKIRQKMAGKDSQSFLQELEEFRLAQLFVASTYLLFSKAYDRISIDSEVVDGDRAHESSLRCRDSAVRAETVASTMIENWRIARDIVRARGGKFLAVLQPVSYVGNAKIDHLDDSLYRPDSAEDFWRVYAEIKKKLKKNRVNWILDLTSTFDTADAVYIDLAHVTQRGNELIAAQIKDAVNQFGLLPL